MEHSQSIKKKKQIIAYKLDRCRCHLASITIGKYISD